MASIVKSLTTDCGSCGRASKAAMSIITYRVSSWLVKLKDASEVYSPTRRVPLVSSERAPVHIRGLGNLRESYSGTSKADTSTVLLHVHVPRVEQLLFRGVLLF